MDTPISGIHTRLERLEERVEELEDAIIEVDQFHFVSSVQTSFGRLAKRLRICRRVEAEERSGSTWGPVDPGRRTRQG